MYGRCRELSKNANEICIYLATSMQPPSLMFSASDCPLLIPPMISHKPREQAFFFYRHGVRNTFVRNIFVPQMPVGYFLSEPPEGGLDLVTNRQGAI